MTSKSVPERQPRHAENGNRQGRGRPSTAPLTANEANCRDVAAFLELEDATAAEDAFLGEPLEAMLHVVRWCMANSEHPDYSPEQMLRGWARKRGRGRWSDRPSEAARIVWGEREPEDTDEERENERLGKLILRYWIERPQRFVALLDEVEAAVTGKRNGNGSRA